MLDDLKLIHERDKSDAIGTALKQWQQLVYGFHKTDTEFNNVANIVVSGMGGSALPAVFLQSWPETIVPLIISRDYSIPKFVNENTLYIASSYSGNTEETLSSMHEAEDRGAKIVVISAGGELSRLAEEKSYPLYVIPANTQPKMCSFFFINALLNILEPLSLIEEGSLNELHKAGEWLKSQVNEWNSDIPTKDNAAKQLALELIGRSVVVYSGPKLFPAANKFKIAVNESAKNIAWVNQYPEFNHNEFVGWSSQPSQKPYSVVEIRSNLENTKIQKRVEVSDQLLSGKRPAPEFVLPKGSSLIQQLVWTSSFLDCVSIYLAILNGLDPTPANLTEKLKDRLNK